jgi:hypothetical protein
MIERRQGLSFGAVTLGLWLAACTGPQLVSINTDLTRLVDQRNKFKTSTDPAGFAKFVEADGELERVTVAALASARDATDHRAKISFYRIAATAAWQRGDNGVLAVTSEGSKSCNDGNGFDLSPRDCVMLMIIPNLVVNDARAAMLAQIQGQAGPPGLPAKNRVVVNDLLDSYKGLAQGEARARASRAPEALAIVIRNQRQTVDGNLATLMKLFIGKSAGPTDDAEITSICNDIRTQAPDATAAANACRTFR